MKKKGTLKLLSKHQQWENKKSKIITDNKYQSFSLFLFLLNGSFIANLILSVVIIVDFTLTPIEKQGICNPSLNRSVNVEFADKSHKSFDLDVQFPNIDLSMRKATCFLTPIFKNTKYFIVTLSTENKIKISDHEVLLPVSFILLNLIATGILFFKSHLIEIDKNSSEINLSPLKRTPDFIDHSNFIVLIFFIPFFLGIMYWIQLYHFLFG